MLVTALFMFVVGYSTRIDLPNLHRQTSIYADIKREGIDMNLSSAGPTRDGYTFTGWNTAADGSGTAYSSGATYTANADNGCKVMNKLDPFLRQQT